MIGSNGFCPKTGASLSEEHHYDRDGRSRRAVSEERGQAPPQTAGELTNGAIRSSRVALITYFRRCHQRHCEPDDDLYRAAATGLQRLKRAADGKQEHDVHIWYALQKRLERAGFDVEWMHAHATLHCLYCHGPLVYDAVDRDAVEAQCGGNCIDTNADQFSRIRSVIASLYTSAFAESEATVPTPDEFLDFSDSVSQASRR